MPQRRVPKRLQAGAAGCAIAIAALSACSTGSAPSSGNANVSTAKHSGPIKILFLQKQGSQDYFVDEMNGAKAAASTLGNVTVTPVDANMDNSATVSAVKGAKALGVNGIIIVPPDGSTGPQDWQFASSEGIPIISADDQVCMNNPNPVACKPGDLLPRVGFDAQQMGTDVGQEAGTLLRQRSGWTASNTRILEEWQFSTTVCTPRVTYADMVFRQSGGPAASSIPAIKVDTDNSESGTPTSAQSKTASTINAYHSITHWIVLGCNDQNVQGAINALSNAGTSPANILAVGLGGDVACKGWEANAPNAMAAALLINGYRVGYDAVTAMVDHVRNGAKFAPLTTVSVTMANKSNWQASGFKCH
jgi:L-arabinose transport system substrate-binding protein